MLPSRSTSLISALNAQLTDCAPLLNPHHYGCQNIVLSLSTCIYLQWTFDRPGSHRYISELDSYLYLAKGRILPCKYVHRHEHVAPFLLCLRPH